MKSTARKWLAACVLLAASGLTLWGVAMPSSGVAARTQAGGVNGQAVRHESTMPTWLGPKPLTGPAAPYRALERLLDPPTWGDNYRANTDTQSPNLAQQEPSISLNPPNPLNVVVMAKDERAGSNTKQTWIYTSTDGGVTWINQMFPFPAPASPFSSDPIVNFSDDGYCYVTSLPYGGGTNDGIQVARSTDGGITFSPGVHLPGSSNSSDKEWTWVDNFPASPFYHNVYSARMDPPGSTVKFNRSTDRGLTWGAALNIASANH